MLFRVECSGWKDPSHAPEENPGGISMQRGHLRELSLG